MRIRMFHKYANIFTSQEHLYRYLYGGQGIVTLESPTGTKHTYSYQKPVNSNHFPDDVRFVYALHTDINDSGEVSYKEFYLGMIENDVFRRTRNSRFQDDSPVVKGAFYIENLRKSQAFLNNSRMIIYHEGVCGLCGAKIWSDKSRERGFGLRCNKNMKLPIIGSAHV